MVTCRENEPIEPYVLTKNGKTQGNPDTGPKCSYMSQSSLVELVSECSQYHVELPLSMEKIAKNQEFFGFSKNTTHHTFKSELNFGSLILRQLTMTDSFEISSSKRG